MRQLRIHRILMANRQIVWGCGNCNGRFKRSKGESMGNECPKCGKENSLYVKHDENIGHKIRVRGGSRKRKDREHKRSGESLNPKHTTGV